VAHVDALRALEQDDETARGRSASVPTRLRARIDATEIVWTQWFDAIGVKPRELIYEEAVADPALVRGVAVDVLRAMGND
jgi:LPS sulfotransferase NodH